MTDAAFPNDYAKETVPIRAVIAVRDRRGVPAGLITMIAAKESPDGYIFAEGQSLSKEDYPELAAVCDVPRLIARRDLWARLMRLFGRALHQINPAWDRDRFRAPDCRGAFVRKAEARARQGDPDHG